MSPIYPSILPFERFLICSACCRHSNVEVEQLQKNAASMTSRIRHLEHALAVSQAQLASNTQSPGYSLSRSGPLDSEFKPTALNNVFNPATCSSSSVSLTTGLGVIALILNSVASIVAIGRSAAKPFYHSYQASQKHTTLWSGTTRTLVGCESTAPRLSED